MRKSKQEAAATRRRIVKAAAAKFRLNGIGGTGLSDLMAARVSILKIPSEAQLEEEDEYR